MQNWKRDTDVQNRLLDSVGEGEGGMFQENSIETCILSRVKQITSPGWVHETSSRAWCTGKTQRDRVEREVGEGIGMGNTCKSISTFMTHISKEGNWGSEYQFCAHICLPGNWTFAFILSFRPSYSIVIRDEEIKKLGKTSPWKQL